MHVNNISIFIFLLISAASVCYTRAQRENHGNLEFLSEDNWDDFIEPFRGQRSSDFPKSDFPAAEAWPTPALSQHSMSSNKRSAKSPVTVTATRIGSSRFFQPQTPWPIGGLGPMAESRFAPVLPFDSEMAATTSVEEEAEANEVIPEKTKPLDMENTTDAGTEPLDREITTDVGTESPNSTFSSSEVAENVDSKEASQETARTPGEEETSFGSDKASQEEQASPENNPKDFETGYTLGKELERQSSLLSFEDTLRQQGIPISQFPFLDQGFPIKPEDTTIASNEVSNDSAIVSNEVEKPTKTNESHSEERPKEIPSRIVETVTVAESDRSSEIVEQLPSPVALVSEINEIRDGPRLEDDFAEAFTRPNPGNRKRRLRPGPGTKRKVRMRVRKLSNANPFTGVEAEFRQPEPITADEAVTKPKRFRSTTTPVPDASPPAIHPDNDHKLNIVVKQGPLPLILKNDDGKRYEVVTPTPQVDKQNSARVEKISTYFPTPIFPKTKPTATPPAEAGNHSSDSSKEWLHASNTKHHDIHHDEPYEEDRDQWEKNYMNLQQNSFYGASPEELGREQGQTLTSLNRKQPSEKKRERHMDERESVQDSRPPGPDIIIVAQEDHSHEGMPGQVHNEFGLRESSGNDLVDITTSEPEQNREFRPNRGKIQQIHHDPALEPEPNHFHEIQVERQVELIPVAVQVEPTQEYYAIETTGPEAHHDEHKLQEVQEVPSRSHYDRTQHQSSEITAEIPFSPPRRPTSRRGNGRRNRAEVENNMNSGLLPSPQSEAQPQPPPLPMSGAPYPPFQSHEFMGFGADQHFDPEKIHNKLIPEAENHFRKSLTNRGKKRKKNSDPALFTQKEVNPFNPQSHTEALPSPQNYGFTVGGLDQSSPFATSQDQSQHYDPSKDPASRTGFQSTQQNSFVPYPQQLQDLANRGPMGHGPRGILPYEGKSPNLAPYPNLDAGDLGATRMEGSQISSSSYQQNVQRGPLGGLAPSSPMGPLSSQQSRNGARIGLIEPTAFQQDQPHGQKAEGNGNGQSEIHSNENSPSNSITLPMPGLVSIPTPPPESFALNQIYANRHYPPHTHSISEKPDYEPANPPVMKGHPLQYHFDPFIQNAGQFNDENQGGRGQQGNQFKSSNGPLSGAFNRQPNGPQTGPPNGAYGPPNGAQNGPPSGAYGPPNGAQNGPPSGAYGTPNGAQNGPPNGAYGQPNGAQNGPPNGAYGPPNGVQHGQPTFNGHQNGQNSAYSPQQGQPPTYTPFVPSQPFPVSDEIHTDNPNKKRRKNPKLKVISHHYDNNNHVGSEEKELEDPSPEYSYETHEHHEEDAEENPSHQEINPYPNFNNHNGQQLQNLGNDAENEENQFIINQYNQQLQREQQQHQHQQHLQQQHQLRQQQQQFIFQQHQQHRPGTGQQPQPVRPATPLYSENAYVLMFPNMVPEESMLPAKPLINGKEIPVISAADLAEQVAQGGILSPGFHAAKVHPREQMLQVLASNHYNMEMEKYMEKKRKPPLPIHTPYGLLIPMGPGANGEEGGHGGLIRHVAGHVKNVFDGLHQKGHLVEVDINKDTPFGNLKAHKTVSYKGGRITTMGGIKGSSSAIEPALELLAEKLAYKLGHKNGESDHEPITTSYTIHHPPTFFTPNADGSIPNPHETSYSEHSPVSIEKNKSKRKSRKGKSKTDQDKELKLALKDLLKERLFEMLEEDAEDPEETKLPEIRVLPVAQAKHRENRVNGHFGNGQQGRPRPSPFHQFPSVYQAQASVQAPIIVPPPTRQRPAAQPASTQGSDSGFLQSLKRFFNFGRQAEQKKGVNYPMRYYIGQNRTESTGQIKKEPQKGIFMHKLGVPVMKHKTEKSEMSQKPETATKKKSKKGMEKMLQLLLKSDETPSSKSDETSASKSTENTQWLQPTSKKTKAAKSNNGDAKNENLNPQRNQVGIRFFNQNQASLSSQNDEEKLMDSLLYAYQNPLLAAHAKAAAGLGGSLSSNHLNQLSPKSGSKNNEKTNENEAMQFNFI